MSMCSAIQPSSRPSALASRSARHFLPSSALPPYPDPTDQTAFSSGKCMMNRRSGLRSPSECRQRVKSSGSFRCIERDLADARHDPHAEDHVLAVGDLDAHLREARSRAVPSGRARRTSCAPSSSRLNSSFSFAFASAGAIQLLLGPASTWSGVHTNVRCSVRATSWGRCDAGSSLAASAGSAQ